MLMTVAKFGVFDNGIIASVLCYTCYLNYIKDPIGHFLLLILAQALLLLLLLLLSFLYLWLLASLRLKVML